MNQPESLAQQATGPAVVREGVSLEEVFAVSYRRLVVQLYGVVGEAGEAEDLVQEAFVRAAALGRRFADVLNPEAWLRTTAINLHRNRWRKLRSLARVSPDLARPRDLPGLEEHLSVIEAMRQLGDEQREVLALFYFADLSVSDIAGTLRIAEGTVKSRLHRARDAMAGLLETEVAGDA